MSLKLSDIGEFGLIDIIKKNTQRSKNVLVGIGDDTAVMKNSGKDLLLFTTDMLAEGTHFTCNTAPEQIGYKALAVSLSDIAAMGGLPTYAVISFGAPASLNVLFVKGILKGIKGAAKIFSVNLVGGDTIRTKKIVINIALLGKVRKQELVKRDGAKKGDVIFVTGQLGRSLKSKKHLKFIPRIKEAQFLVKKFKPSSMIDVSDGLIADLKHICEESKVGAVIYKEKIPRTKNATLEEALYDGEDFELLFTLSKSKARKFENAKTNFRFKRIGEIVDKGKFIQVIGSKGKILGSKRKGFDHYR